MKFFREYTVTKAFIAANLSVAGLSELYAWLGRHHFIQDLFALAWDQAKHGQVWRFFTYMWIHAGVAEFGGLGVLHLLLNMAGLWMFGRIVERQLGAFSLLGIFAASGIVAAVAHFFLLAAIGGMGFEVDPISQRPLLGASGAVLGILGAFVALYPNAKLYVFPLPFPIRALTFLRWFIVLSCVFQCAGIMSFMAHFAHVGGIICGYLAARHILPAALGVRVSENTSPLIDPSLLSEGEIRRETDPILEKIAANGMASLSPRERKILVRASRLLK
jgi:membrane associated rhomboid family serine protease